MFVQKRISSMDIDFDAEATEEVEEVEDTLEKAVHINRARLKTLMDLDNSQVGEKINEEDPFNSSMEFSVQDDQVSGGKQISYGLSKYKEMIQKQFPQDTEAQRDLMLQRAYQQFQLSNKKQNIEQDEVEKKNRLKFIHFHIEAFDSNIAMNKINDKLSGEEDFLKSLKMLEKNDHESRMSSPLGSVKSNKLSASHQKPAL